MAYKGNINYWPIIIERYLGKIKKLLNVGLQVLPFDRSFTGSYHTSSCNNYYYYYFLIACSIAFFLSFPYPLYFPGLVSKLSDLSCSSVGLCHPIYPFNHLLHVNNYYWEANPTHCFTVTGLPLVAVHVVAIDTVSPSLAPFPDWSISRNQLLCSANAKEFNAVLRHFRFDYYSLLFNHFPDIVVKLKVLIKCIFFVLDLLNYWKMNAFFYNLGKKDAKFSIYSTAYCGP